MSSTSETREHTARPAECSAATRNWLCESDRQGGTAHATRLAQEKADQVVRLAHPSARVRRGSVHLDDLSSFFSSRHQQGPSISSCAQQQDAHAHHIQARDFRDLTVCHLFHIGQPQQLACSRPQAVQHTTHIQSSLKVGLYNRLALFFQRKVFA